MIKCPVCGYEEPIDYFVEISKLREKYEEQTGLEATHLIIGFKDYYKMENSKALFDRLKYVKDTTQGVLGTYIVGLQIIKTQSIEGYMVGNLL